MNYRGGNNRNKILLYVMIGVIIFLCTAILGGLFYINRIKRMVTERPLRAIQTTESKLKKMLEASGDKSENVMGWFSLLEDNGRQVHESEQRLKQEFENLIEMQISTTHQRITKEIDEKIGSLKKLLAANMLNKIETRFTTTQRDVRGDERFFTAMIDKLGEINKTHSAHIVSLEKKLGEIQKVKMVAQPMRKEREISQSEVDSIIKQEVRKQLSSFNGRRSSRLRRLKKVVALEKMRRLVRGMVNGEDNEDILDF